MDQLSNFLYTLDPGEALAIIYCCWNVAIQDHVGNFADFTSRSCPDRLWSQKTQLLREMKLPGTALVLTPGTLSVLFTAGSLAPRTVSTTEWAHDENVLNEGINHEKPVLNCFGEDFCLLLYTILHTSLSTTQLNDYNNNSFYYWVLTCANIALSYIHTHIHGYTRTNEHKYIHFYLKLITPAKMEA